jgi:hypothetical protein
MNRPIDDAFTECAKAALAADFDPVPWDEAPRWRQLAAYAVADAALNTNNPDHTRAAWVTEMVAQGWRWSQEYDETKKTSSGIVFGELTGGGTKHWINVVRCVREVGKRLGVRMLEPST